mmetsp:Transcript_32545/g.82688  ORF Transcript_32545/g.82688 Transcript_32545/m.82688 type:complete len:312 (+) Transcript_32545:434-1369(+)
MYRQVGGVLLLLGAEAEHELGDGRARVARLQLEHGRVAALAHLGVRADEDQVVVGGGPQAPHHHGRHAQVHKARARVRGAPLLAQAPPPGHHVRGAPAQQPRHQRGGEVLVQRGDLVDRVQHKRVARGHHRGRQHAGVQRERRLEQQYGARGQQRVHHAQPDGHVAELKHVIVPQLEAVHKPPRAQQHERLENEVVDEGARVRQQQQRRQHDVGKAKAKGGAVAQQRHRGRARDVGVDELVGLDDPLRLVVHAPCIGLCARRCGRLRPWGCVLLILHAPLVRGLHGEQQVNLFAHSFHSLCQCLASLPDAL